MHGARSAHARSSERPCTEHGALVHVVRVPLHVVGALCARSRSAHARSSERSCTELGALMHGVRVPLARSPSATCTESECHLHGVRVPSARSTEPGAPVHGDRVQGCTKSECPVHEVRVPPARSPSAWPRSPSAWPRSLSAWPRSSSTPGGAPCPGSHGRQTRSARALSVYNLTSPVIPLKDCRRSWRFRAFSKGAECVRVPQQWTHSRCPRQRVLLVRPHDYTLAMAPSR